MRLSWTFFLQSLFFLVNGYQMLEWMLLLRRLNRRTYWIYICKYSASITIFSHMSNSFLLSFKLSLWGFVYCKRGNLNWTLRIPLCCTCQNSVWTWWNLHNRFVSWIYELFTFLYFLLFYFLKASNFIHVFNALKEKLTVSYLFDKLEEMLKIMMYMYKAHYFDHLSGCFN